MPCYCPLRAYRTREGITFQRSQSVSGEPLDLPCGQCVGCRLERSRQWAVRCLHEQKLWRNNCFVTLTYDNKNLPPGGTLIKRDLALFMKRLRKVKPVPLRFYACGEYGELNKRPHYHAILFNCDFPDKLLYSKNGRGDCLYNSAELATIWTEGNHLIGDVTFESAAYVARYCLKKITGAAAADHYSVIDGDGVVYERIPEFTVMSRRPGVGSGYYDRYGSEVRDHDSLVVNGHEVLPPRFYDTRTELFSPKMWDMIRKKRKLRGVLSKPDNTVDRRRVKEILAIKRLQQLERIV